MQAISFLKANRYEIIITFIHLNFYYLIVMLSSFKDSSCQKNYFIFFLMSLFILDIYILSKYLYKQKETKEKIQKN